MHQRILFLNDIVFLVRVDSKIVYWRTSDPCSNVEKIAKKKKNLKMYKQKRAPITRELNTSQKIGRITFKYSKVNGDNPSLFYLV